MTDEAVDLPRAQLPPSREIKDPKTGIVFKERLTDHQLQTVMGVREQLDSALDKAIAKNAKEIAKAKAMIAEAEREVNLHQVALGEFDERYLPGVRATVLANRLDFNMTSAFTQHYQISCTIPKTRRPHYDVRDPEVVAWAKEHCPQVLKDAEVSRQQMNRVIKELDIKDIPPCIEMKVDDPKFGFTRLT